MTFPLGEPVNRKKEPDLTPVANRPGWWKDRQGVERYIEPPKPVPTIWDVFGVANPHGSGWAFRSKS